MIIVKLMGGLGNQLFQYALGRHLAKRHSTELKFDISAFDRYKLHRYSLSPFGVQENLASSREVRMLTVRPQGLVGDSLTKLRITRPQPADSYFKEKRTFHYDPAVLSLPDDTYLDGYWQSEKYFAEISTILRREFRVQKPQTGKDRELAAAIKGHPSVSIHIRRADYVTNPKTNAAHGTCSLDYYRHCAALVSQAVKEPRFFAFSDDPEWVRENLKLPYPMTFVDHNGPQKNYEDLRLMSQCQHHIIANSSFSWWGAWLNDYADKQVYAPRQWYAESDGYLKDVTPDDWRRV